MKSNDKISIKNNWNEVTISDFLKIQEIKPEDFVEVVDYYISILSILSDKDRDYLYNIPYVNLPYLMEEVKFIGTMPSGKVKTSYEINGTKYNATLNVRELSAMQYIDIVTLLKSNKNNDKIHYILAVILIPESKKHNTEDYNLEESANEILNHFNIADAYALSLFFSTLLDVLIKVTVGLSRAKIRKMMKKEKSPERLERMKSLLKDIKRFQRNGAGSII